MVEVFLWENTRIFLWGICWILGLFWHILEMVYEILNNCCAPQCVSWKFLWWCEEHFPACASKHVLVCRNNQTVTIMLILRFAIWLTAPCLSKSRNSLCSCFSTDLHFEKVCGLVGLYLYNELLNESGWFFFFYVFVIMWCWDVSW